MLLLVWCNYSAPIVSPHKIGHPTRIHKILYIDPNFSDEEVVYIRWAADDWEKVTKGIVSFEILMMPQKIIDGTKGIIIYKVNNYHPDIILLDRTSHNETFGFYNQNHQLPNIELVANRLNRKNWKQTILHELGHAIGLEHIEGEEGIGTLMYSSIENGSSNITKTDLEYFCKIYRCKASKLIDQ